MRNKITIFVQAILPNVHKLNIFIMKLIKLTSADYKRSLSARGFNHVWLYSKSNTTQRSHNNSIFLTRTIGEPFGCLVIEYNSTLNDDEICKLFGKDIFIEGGVSPDDKENMKFDCFYIKP